MIPIPADKYEDKREEIIIDEKNKIKKYIIVLGTFGYSWKLRPYFLRNKKPSKEKSTRWTTALKDWFNSPTSVNKVIRIRAIINRSPKIKPRVIKKMRGRV